MSGDIAKSQQMSDPPASFGLARAKLFTTGQLTRKKRQLRSGQSTPEDLRHDPVPHGADWCDADCPGKGRTTCLLSVDITLALEGSTAAPPDVPEDGVSTPDIWTSGTSCTRRTERTRSRGATPPLGVGR